MFSGKSAHRSAYGPLRPQYSVLRRVVHMVVTGERYPVIGGWKLEVSKGWDVVGIRFLE